MSWIYGLFPTNGVSNDLPGQARPVHYSHSQGTHRGQLPPSIPGYVTDGVGVRTKSSNSQYEQANANQPTIRARYHHMLRFLGKFVVREIYTLTSTHWDFPSSHAVETVALLVQSRSTEMKRWSWEEGTRPEIYLPHIYCGISAVILSRLARLTRIVASAEDLLPRLSRFPC
jgi:hypothetical protein